MKLPKLPGAIASAGAVSALLVFSVFPALAQTPAQTSGNGFRISPVRSEFTIEKGQSEVLSMTLENPADVPITARAIVNDFVASDKEDGEPRLILDEDGEAPKNSFKTLVQPIKDVRLGAHENKDIKVSINIPENANSGGYYGAVRFVPVNEGDSDTGNVGLTASVGTIVLVRVPGNLTERVDLLQLSASQGGTAKSFIMAGDVSALVRLRNEGDIHVKPFGKVVIKDMFGNKIHDFEFNIGEGEDSRSNILPGSTRKFENELPKRRWLGRYTIEANLGYSQGSGDLIIAKASFWYIPVWALIILFLLILALIGGGYWLYRRYSGMPLRSVKRRRK